MFFWEVTFLKGKKLFSTSIAIKFFEIYSFKGNKFHNIIILPVFSLIIFFHHHHHLLTRFFLLYFLFTYNTFIFFLTIILYVYCWMLWALICYLNKEEKKTFPPLYSRLFPSISSAALLLYTYTLQSFL